MTSDTSADPADIPFTQEHIEVMADALVEVCAALKIPEERTRDRDVVADRIIGLAGTGVLDARLLCERVIAEVKTAQYLG
jgi:hypothetical protein